MNNNNNNYNNNNNQRRNNLNITTTNNTNNTTTPTHTTTSTTSTTKNKLSININRTNSNNNNYNNGNKYDEEDYNNNEIKSPLRRLRSIARLSNAFNYSFQDGYLCAKPTNISRLHTRCITVIKISSGPEPFVVSAGLDCLLIFSKYNTGEVLKEINTDNSFVFDISILKTNDNEVIVATASQDGAIRIYDINNDYRCITSIKQSSLGVCQIVWSVQLFKSLKPNDRTSYCISAGATKIIHVIDWKTQEELCSLSGHKEGIRCLAISDDGIIASGSNDHSVKLWNLYQQRFIQTLRGHTAEVNSVVYVSNTSFLVTACENNIFRQWNYHTGERLQIFDGYDGTSILTLSVIPAPYHPLILVGGTVSEKSISPLVSLQIWDLSTGLLVGTCVGTRYQISSISAWYNTINKSCYIVAGGLDSTIRMWHLTPNLLPQLDDGDGNGDDDLKEGKYFSDEEFENNDDKGYK